MITSKENDERFKIRAYLLGMCKDLSEQEKTEEELLLNADFFQELLLQEYELIEDYVYDKLGASERKFFESHFLISVERRKKVRIEYLIKNNIGREDLEKTKGNRIQNKLEDFKRFFLSPIPIGFSILLILATSFFLWNFYSTNSDEQQKALVSLNKAYKVERPLEARISKFEYAPYEKIRDQDEPKVDWISQNLAERISLDEVSADPTAENQHLLARVYLAKREFKKAIELLKESLKKSPENPEILSDIGTTYLEQSKTISKDDEKLALVADAVENFDKSLAINPNLLSARFNKAIAMEIYLPNRAKQAWQEYLDLDQTSNWAKEAKEHLEVLNKQEIRIISTAKELESAFLEAFGERNDEKAFRIVSQNRELINGKYLPQKFAMGIVDKKKTKKIKILNF